MQTKLPEEFIARVTNQFPDKHEEILETFKHRKPTTFRVNTLKAEIEALVDSLESQGFVIEKSDILGAFILRSKSQRELIDTDEYKNGLLYIQGLSSMLPPINLDPQPGELVLDACSAPGSKTTQMAAMMKNTGQIIANDMSKVRLYKLAANIKTLGATNIQITHLRAQDLWKKFPNTFDKVLVDVPCSLEGRFFEDDPKTYRNWSPKKVKILAEHQKHILRSAITCAKSGAEIVYSTCTLSTEENEAVIDWILNGESDLTLEKMERILPTQTMEAFFVAKFKKQ